MINLDSIAVRNFLSWGDYNTIVSLANRGQCFVAGEIEECEAMVAKSNGAGKSSLMQAILWCLSGKTMYKRNPGNGVLNRFTENDCAVSLRFQDGSELTRIRHRDGDTELLYSKDEKRIIDCTLSTTSNQQGQLEKELGFDYDIFCGSVFFNQFGHSWMEMGEQARKQTMERIMGVDRLSIYAEVAKKKRDRVEVEQSKLKAQADGLQLVVTSLSEQIATTQRLSEKFDHDRAARIQTKLIEANEFQRQADEFKIIDTGELAKRWTIVKTIEAKIKAMREKSRALEQQAEILETEHDEKENALEEQVSAIEEKFGIAIDAANKKYAQEHKELKNKHETAIKALQQKQSATRGTVIGSQSALKDVDESIQLWQSKEGRICSECEQEVPKTHTTSKIEPKLARKGELQQQIIDARQTQIDLEGEEGFLAETHEDLIAGLDEEVVKRTRAIQDECDEITLALRKKFEANDLPQQIEDIKIEKKKIDETIESTEERLANSAPEKTVSEAEAENAKQNLFAQQAKRAQDEAAAIEQQSNPHLDTIADLKGRITLKQNELDRVNKDVAKYNLIFAHLHYIYRAYSERRKIKSFMIGKHRPYFNSRLSHYLDSFTLDVKIQLTDSLGLDSNLWGYNFQSGGERAKTNLAFLFAVFDLHSGIHGRQCNMLVLDEPDHHLDEAGRTTLIDIINNDLACRFETIFIISHNNAFKDVFPSQLTVRRIDRLSYLDESR